jgi:hypothetical protein
MAVFSEHSLLVLPPPFLGLLLRKSPLADRGGKRTRRVNDQLLETNFVLA